ncbi:MAG: acyltransferase [Lachnospiraceae bacterium]|nr:acyltransferase [Lachnospiraceae bacterium]
MKKKEYTTVDLMKFIFAICVVAIHTSLLNVNDSFSAWLVSSLLLRSAVPFFFVISGFFLADKIFRFDRSEKDKIRLTTKNYCRKLLPPLMVWGGVGLIIDIFSRISQGLDLMHILFYAFRTIVYPKNAMWYLLALIIGAVIITELYLRTNKWWVPWIFISIIGYTFVLLCNNYYFLIDDTAIGSVTSLYIKLCESARNGIFYSPFYIGLGFVIQNAYKKGWLLRFKKTACGGLIVGVVLILLEASLIYELPYLDDRGVFISQVILIPCIVIICLLHDIKIELPYKLMRRLSTSIYFTHRTISSVIVSLPFYNENTIVLFVVTTIAAIIVALISYRINNEKVHAVFG